MWPHDRLGFQPLQAHQLLMLPTLGFLISKRDSVSHTEEQVIGHSVNIPAPHQKYISVYRSFVIKLCD